MQMLLFFSFRGVIYIKESFGMYINKINKRDIMILIFFNSDENLLLDSFFMHFAGRMDNLITMFSHTFSKGRKAESLVSTKSLKYYSFF